MTVLRPKPQDTSEQAGIGALDYSSLPGLEEVLLEDSLVLEIVESPSFLSFTLLAALAPSHPAYETHCFRSAALTFPGTRKVTWSERHDARFIDAAGLVDRGNIDGLVADPGGFYRVEGDWGVVDVVSGPPQLEILGAQSAKRTLRIRQLEAWMDGRPIPTDLEADEDGDPDHDHHHHDHDRGHHH
jgi:hypothetical protein